MKRNFLNPFFCFSFGIFIFCFGCNTSTSFQYTSMQQAAVEYFDDGTSAGVIDTNQDGIADGFDTDNDGTPDFFIPDPSTGVPDPGTSTDPILRDSNTGNCIITASTTLIV